MDFGKSIAMKRGVRIVLQCGGLISFIIFIVL